MPCAASPAEERGRLAVKMEILANSLMYAQRLHMLMAKSLDEVDHKNDLLITGLHHRPHTAMRGVAAPASPHFTGVGGELEDVNGQRSVASREPARMFHVGDVLLT